MSLSYFQTPAARNVGRATITNINSGATITDVAAAVTEVVSATQRLIIDFTGRSQIRMSGFITQAGNAGSKFHMQYALLSAPTVWADLNPKASGLDLTVTSSTVVQLSSWADIPAAARTAVMTRLVSVDGDAAADPTYRGIEIHFR